MPNGDAQQVDVTIQGKVWTIPKAKLAAAQARGAKLVTVSTPNVQEGTGTKIARGATLGAFSGLGIPETEHPIQDLAKGITSGPSHRQLACLILRPEDSLERLTSPDHC